MSQEKRARHAHRATRQGKGKARARDLARSDLAVTAGSSGSKWQVWGRARPQADVHQPGNGLALGAVPPQAPKMPNLTRCRT